MSSPDSVLETEAAVRTALAVRAGGYEVQVTPRENAVDLGAARHGTVWATFHIEVDARRPLFLRVGATVFGGARVEAGGSFSYDDAASYDDGRLERFVRDRLELACRRGREQEPDHCEACPMHGPA